MAEQYVLQLQIDGSGAIQALNKVDNAADKLQNKLKAPGGAAKGAASATGQLAEQFDQLDDLFGKVGGSAGTVADSFKVLRTALLGSGIGAIVVLVGELINNFDQLTALIDGVSDQEQELLDTANKRAEAEKFALDQLNGQDNILKLQGLSEKEILKLKMQQTEQTIASIEASIEAGKVITENQVAAAKRNKDILTGILQFLTAPLRLLAEYTDKAAGLIGIETGLTELLDKGLDKVASFVFDPEAIQAEADAAVKAQETTLLQLRNAQAGYQLQVRAINKQAADAAIAEQQRIAAEEAKILEDRKKTIGEFNELALRNTLDTKNKEAEIIKTSGKNRLMVEAETAQKSAEYEESLSKQKVQLSQDAVGALISLNESLAGNSEKSAKRSFQIGKGLALAQAIQNTYAAANAVLKDPTLIGPSRFVAVATTIAAGLANVIKISRTKFQASGGGDTGGGSSSPTPSFGGQGSAGGGVPTFNPVNLDFLQGRPSPVQAYVVPGTITSTMEASEKIDNLARL